jgi:iron(III) transport system substrate-binding protein
MFAPKTAGAAEVSSDEPLRGLDVLSGTDRERVLLEKAKVEGEVTIYSILTATEADFILGEFKKKYPFLKTLHWRGRGSDIYQKIMTEAGAGKMQADVAIGGTTELPAAVQRGFLSRYISPHRKYYPETFTDPKGYWIGINVIGAVLAHNEAKLRGRTPPSAYQDLLRPEWKSDVSVDTEPDNSVAVMLIKWGKAKTEKYVKDLMQQQPKLAKGNTLRAQMLCSGEFAVAMDLYTHRVADLMNKGCPIKFEFPKEFTPIIIDSMALMNKSPHPFAGALFFDWLSSKEGMEVYRKYGRVPPRSDVEPIYPVLKGLPKRSGLVVLNPGVLSKEVVDNTWDIIKNQIQQ